MFLLGKIATMILFVVTGGAIYRIRAKHPVLAIFAGAVSVIGAAYLFKDIMQDLARPEQAGQVAIFSEWEMVQKMWNIPETVLIPGGTFSMGCVSGKWCQANEKPVHRVTVDKFYMSKYETITVTVY